MSKQKINCSVCGNESPFEVKLSKLKRLRFDRIVCPECKTTDIKKEWYEVATIQLNALGGWNGITLSIPDSETLAALERAEAIRDKALKQVGEL